MLIRIFGPWIALAAVLGFALGGTFVRLLQEVERPETTIENSGTNLASPVSSASVVHSARWYDSFLDHMPDWFVAAFTGVLSVVTFLLVRSTNRLWEAGERQVTLSRTVAVSELRAYLQVKLTAVPTIHEGVEPTAALTISNFGKTPAYNLRVAIEMGIDDFPIRPNRSVKPVAENHPVEVALLPGDSLGLNHAAGRPLSKKDAAEIVAGSTACLFLRGRVDYEDTFGTARFVRFFLTYGGADLVRGEMRMHSSGNNST